MDTNRASLNFYGEMAKQSTSPYDTKLQKRNDFSQYDVKLILEHSHNLSSLMDFGSGGGLIINQLVDHFSKIIAIEYFEEFSRFILKAPNLSIVNEDLLLYEPEMSVDLVTMFGTAHHFNTDESLLLYKKAYNALHSDGVFILKNQFGLGTTKVVTYSDELDKDYFAEYRDVSFEVDRLKTIGFSSIDIVDLYPPEANRWSDTHFYALTCKK